MRPPLGRIDLKDPADHGTEFRLLVFRILYKMILEWILGSCALVQGFFAGNRLLGKPTAASEGKKRRRNQRRDTVQEYNLRMERLQGVFALNRSS
jgi:hypothetical protein